MSGAPEDEYLGPSSRQGGNRSLHGAQAALQGTCESEAWSGSHCAGPVTRGECRPVPEPGPAMTRSSARSEGGSSHAPEAEVAERCEYVRWSCPRGREAPPSRAWRRGRMLSEHVRQVLGEGFLQRQLLRFRSAPEPNRGDADLRML